MLEAREVVEQDTTHTLRRLIMEPQILVAVVVVQDIMVLTNLLE